MDQKRLLKNVSVVLCRPRFPENIGAAARACRNMGMGGLVVVSPECLDEERMLRMATHKAAGLIKTMQVHDDLGKALAPFGYIAGTTARVGTIRRAFLSPRESALEVLQHAPHNAVALLFGSEDRGLTNDEIRFCHQLVKIPTADFSSLNLAQAVMVMCYEIFCASFDPPERRSSQLASSEELELMYARVRDILVMISFIQPENPEHWMMNIRRFCSRLGLQTSDVNLIMGICRQVDWYSRHCYAKGKEERENGIME
ncbi:MAG TPA: RNA methyltransferase [Thermodesulfobacteriota bacterium]|nr:RNA methyltransferase [Deltaproteobacteria bacterium]HNU71489.1 RNA methyltransferase [Thermodesulfobacteriota bacterium]HQO78323.1 RNA methyltransferase [Thermodesulfobacteriota bacterium]